MKTPIETEENISEKTSRPNVFLVLSSTFFALVCAASLFFFFENTSLSRAIDANKNEMAEYQSSIDKIKSDSNTIRAELVSSNKAALAATIEKSAAQKYINGLQDIATKYKMMFSGFSYSNGKVATSAVAIPERVLAGEDGIKKISDFIRDYRTGTNLMFQLSPVLAVTGYEQKRMFSLEFSVAPTSWILPQK